MKKALIAGGAGFIGYHFTKMLLEKNYDVLVIDSLITGQEKNINDLKKLGAEFLKEDIQNLSSIDFNPDEIYNLASPASPVDFKKIPTYILESGSLGQKRLLEIARKNQARILFASTSEVYGNPLEHPQKESYLGNVNCIGERGCYDEAKRYGEAITMAYAREHKVNTRIVRIFNTYGPRMRSDDGRLIPNFITQALKKQKLTVYGNGQQTRSLCYVQDLIEGIYKLMQSDVTEPVNIGNDKEMTILEIAETINSLLKNDQGVEYHPLPQDDPLQRRPHLSKAKSKLGWEPTTLLTDGLEKTIHYFKQ